MSKTSYWLADSTWQTARVYIRSFDGGELLADGVVTIRPGDSLGYVASQYAKREGIKNVRNIRLEVIE
jgi:hypothetical protein